MKAAFYSRQGPAAEVFQFGEQPTPVPGPGEVRVRLRASGVNPSDWKVRKGGFNRPLLAPTIIPHSDGAGDIDAVGEGVASSRIGERVWVWNAQWKRASGTAAEYVTLPSAQAVRLPRRITYDEGACLGIPAFTAVHAVRLAELQPGMKVFVAGGAGSVGHYVVQIAKNAGATVVTTVSSDRKAAHARAAGADHVINYRTENVAARLKEVTNGIGVDAVIEMDLTGNAMLYPDILRPKATVVVYGMSRNEATLPSLWLMQNGITLRFFLIYEVDGQAREAALAELCRLLKANALQHTIAMRLPLEQAARAHDIVEEGHVMGNVVLEIE